MDLQTKTIFLKESEKDLFLKLKESGIDTSKFKFKFEELFKRVYNNEVGYYSFIQDDIVYKFVVLPKTIDVDDENKERDFVNYLLHYYRINNIYSFDTTKKIPNSILTLAFESNNKENSAHNPIEEFEFYKTKSILKSIEAFFKKHKNYKRVDKDYVSQSIKYKLNIRKNITELNKSKVHQSRKVDIVFSQIATVSYFALKLYIQKKVKDKELKNIAQKISNFLSKKYFIDSSFSFSITKLHSLKVNKICSRKKEHKLLLADLKSLFGYEQFYKDNKNFVQTRSDIYTSSFFINPSLFYEWYVYDILKEYTNKEGLELRFDKQESQTTTKYYLNDKEDSSKPDFIITDNNKKVHIILDAKWKYVNGYKDIKKDDYLKLKFDANLLKDNKFGVVPYLVYPKTTIDDRKFKIRKDKNEIFNFNILEIDMDFKNRDNSLSFAYDFSKEAEILEKEKIEENSKNIANEVSREIESKRADLIVKIIKIDNEEEKENLGGLFDETLWQSSQELISKLDKEIILPEVKEILNKFDDVLEEDSKTFLKSSSTIYANYKDDEEIDFDYSMPGSGLWKLIEVEMNTSFIWQLRILSGVCNNNNPWNKICKRNAKIDQMLNNGKKVSLSMSDKKDKSKLQSVMLGGIKLLLEDSSTLSEYDDFFQEYPNYSDFVKNDLKSVVEKLIEYRNEHAHIKAMNKDKFDNLWDLLFKKENNINILEKILLFKSEIIIYIKGN